MSVLNLKLFWPKGWTLYTAEVSVAIWRAFQGGKHAVDFATRWQQQQLQIMLQIFCACLSPNGKVAIKEGGEGGVACESTINVAMFQGHHGVGFPINVYQQDS